MKKAASYLGIRKKSPDFKAIILKMKIVSKK